MMRMRDPGKDKKKRNFTGSVGEQLSGEAGMLQTLQICIQSASNHLIYSNNQTLLPNYFQLLKTGPEKNNSLVL